MTIKNVTIGSDAEMFVKSIKDGSVFPVCGLIGGTKKKPKQMGGGGFFVQEDNVLIEFNIPVCRDKKSFITSMATGVSRAKNQLPPSLHADIIASAHIDKAFLSIHQACVFGCEPDFNAWKREVNPRPHADDPTLRTAAAHVHIGWDEPNDDDRHALIQMADLCAAVPAVLEDKDTERRKLYGKAGAFRVKEYGVEHRVLSNYWIRDNVYVGQVWERYMSAITRVNRGDTLSDKDAELVQLAINDNNRDLAKDLINRFRLI